MPAKTIVIRRGMEKKELDALISKVFAGTIYETAGDLEVFTKIWNEAQDKLQAKWKAESEALGDKHTSYTISLKNAK